MESTTEHIINFFESIGQTVLEISLHISSDYDSRYIRETISYISEGTLVAIVPRGTTWLLDPQSDRFIFHSQVITSHDSYFDAISYNISPL